MESTFALLKPCAVVRGLIGEIITWFERKGLKIVALKMTKVSREKAEKLYAIHEGKPFHDGLIQHIISAPVVALVIEGENAVNVVRKLVGATDPSVAQSGTIRADLSMSTRKNIVHAADSYETAHKEIMMFFKRDEISAYKRADEDWI